MNGFVALLLVAVTLCGVMAGLGLGLAKANGRNLERAVQLARANEARTQKCGVCGGSGTGSDRAPTCWRCRGTGLPPGSAVPSVGDA